MKDKLQKTGHKKAYYRLLSFVKGVGFSLLALVVLATPIAIVSGISASEASAEQTSHVEEVEESPSSSSLV